MDIEDILFKSRDLFFHFVKECNSGYRQGDDLNSYRKIVQAHRDINNIEELLKEDKFIIKIRETLVYWNMDSQAAELQTIEIIKRNILNNQGFLKDLYGYKLHKISSLQDDNGETILRKLKFLFKNLNVMKTDRQIVGVSKTLHFLLPDLVLPIDGKYTMNFFYGYNKYADNIDKEFETFNDIFTRSHQIIRKLSLCDNDLDGIKWNTSIPKLVDNAIIGFSREFEDYIYKFADEGIDNFIKSLSIITNIENSKLRKYLEKRKEKILNSERKKIERKIIIQKAIDAGIKVTEEEIDEYIKQHNIKNI